LRLISRDRDSSHHTNLDPRRSTTLLTFPSAAEMIVAFCDQFCGCSPNPHEPEERSSNTPFPPAAHFRLSYIVIFRTFLNSPIPRKLFLSSISPRFPIPLPHARYLNL